MLPQDPGRDDDRELAHGLESACLTDDPPARDGEVIIGFDLGGSRKHDRARGGMAPSRAGSKSFGAFPGDPRLALARGAADGVGGLYARHGQTRGEVALYAGRVTPVAAVPCRDCAAKLAGERVIAAASDRYRKAEAIHGA